jgi:hypothetical protein
MTDGHFLQVVRQEILYPQSSGLLTAILTSSGSLAIIFTCGLVTFHYRVMPQEYLFIRICIPMIPDYTLISIFFFCAHLNLQFVTNDLDMRAGPLASSAHCPCR